LPLEPQRVHAVGEVDALLGGQPLHHRHAVVEVSLDGQDAGAIGEGLHQLRGGDLAAGEDDQRADAGGRAVGGQRRRGVPGGGARHRGDGLAVGDHLLDRRDQHGHSQILERAGVGVAAELDPEILQAERGAVALRPEEVGPALVHRDHVLVADVGVYPLALAPDARAEGPLGAQVAIVEQLGPFLRGALLERREIVADLQQVLAARAAKDDLVEPVLARASGDAAKHGAIGSHP
jgi:hypothetical protein